MRTAEDLESPEFNDDMTGLDMALNKAGIQHVLRRHPGAEPGLKGIIGYYPTGEWQILIGDVSVIRGMCSFGMYEAYGGKFEDPERFETPEELIKALL